MLVLAAATTGLGVLCLFRPIVGGVLSAVAGLVVLTLWVRCTHLAARTAALFEHVANDLGLTHCEPVEE